MVKGWVVASSFAAVIWSEESLFSRICCFLDLSLASSCSTKGWTESLSRFIIRLNPWWCETDVVNRPVDSSSSDAPESPLEPVPGLCTSTRLVLLGTPDADVEEDGMVDAGWDGAEATFRLLGSLLLLLLIFLNGCLDLELCSFLFPPGLLFLLFLSPVSSLHDLMVPSIIAI